MKRTIVLLAQIFLVVLAWGQDARPCTRLLSEGVCTESTPPVSRSTAALSPWVTWLHDNPTQGLNMTNPDARYETFWITGDGNFIKRSNGGVDSDRASMYMSYVYNRPNTYDVYPLLVEKKSNRQPPGYTQMRVGVPGISGGASTVSYTKNIAVGGLAVPVVDNFTKTIYPPYKADITASSETARLDGATTALVVSAPFTTDSEQTILLYFNSVFVDGSTTYESGTLFPVEEIKYARPVYANSEPFVTDLNYLPFPFNEIARNKYGNIMLGQLSYNNDLVPPGFDEFRFFPLLKTKGPDDDINTLNTGIPQLNNRPMGKTQVLALILQNTQVNSDPNDNNPFALMFDTLSNSNLVKLKDEERSKILEVIRQHAAPLLSGLDTISLRMSNGAYIRGAYYKELGIRTVIDPTELKILSICKGEADKYEVKLRMTICNEGNEAVDVVSAEIYNVAGLQVIDPSSSNTSVISSTTSNTIWQYNHLNLGSAYVNGTFSPSCISDDFSFKTNWEGVQKLVKEGALEAKIKFSNALLNPVQDFKSLPLDDAPVNETCGYKCGDCDKKSDCTWLYVLLFVLALVGFWYWKNEQEEKKKNNA